MSKPIVKAFTATALALAVSSFAFGVSAQDAKKAAKTPAAPASVCKGLDETACKGKAAECSWIVPKKGKQKPYCRAKPKSAAKKK